jgi:hypothetical protein
MAEMALTIHTIGYFSQPVEQLLALLRQHAIEVVADVRSASYARYAPQFNQPELRAAIVEAGPQYVFLGKELGGRPADPLLYDEAVRVDYRRVSQTELFRAGIERVKRCGTVPRGIDVQRGGPDRLPPPPAGRARAAPRGDRAAAHPRRRAS